MDDNLLYQLTPVFKLLYHFAREGQVYVSPVYIPLLIMIRPFVSYCVQVYCVAIARKRSPYIATKI